MFDVLRIFIHYMLSGLLGALLGGVLWASGYFQALRDKE